MNAYRLALQQFLLDHGLNRESFACDLHQRCFVAQEAPADKPANPYDRLEAFTVGIFVGGWLLAILSHL